MSSSPVDLRVDWCSYKAAKWAVEHWHYSGSMPSGKLIKLGAWEDGSFVGCVLFGRGANRNIGVQYELKQVQVTELVRVALKEHITPTTRIVSSAIRMISSQSPGLRLMVSYADERHGHLGIIYQAMNWIYVGDIPLDLYEVNGVEVHPRSVFSSYGTRSLDWLRNNVNEKFARVDGVGKHKYLYPLDRAMRRQIAPLAQPYPKRETSGPSVDGDTPVPTGEAGSTPAVRS